jgi:predicted esterase
VRIRQQVALAVVAIVILATVVVRPAHAATRYMDEVFTSVQKTSDIVYGNAEGQDLHLDLYEPVGDAAASRAVFIWAHGGYFTQGNMCDIGSIAQFMVKRGFVVASIQYRLDPSLPEGLQGYLDRQDPKAGLQLLEAIRDAQHDMYAAIRWARKNAVTYRLNPNAIATGGHSAGATTSVAVAYNSDDVGDSGNPGYPSNTNGAIGTGTLNAPFMDIHPDPLVEPPVAMFHGGLDESPEEAPRAVCAIAKLMQNFCTVTVYPNDGHSSRSGLAEWPKTLFRLVVHKMGQPALHQKKQVLPTIPTMRIPSSTLP